MLASNARRTRLQSRLVAGAVLLATGALSASGCTLVTDVDRSKIESETPTPPPPSGSDAGGEEPPPADSGAEPPPEETPDAALESDAEAPPVDAAEPPPADAG